MDRVEYRDTKIAHALQVARSTFGVNASVDEKAKDLLKFGSNVAVGTSETTIMTLPSGQTSETFVSTNAITHVASTQSGDTGSLVVEGHTIGEDGFTFVTQSVTLAGNTKTALATPLARVARAYNDTDTEFAGVIYVAEDVTFSSGVPQTATAIHLMIPAGRQQSEKCATTLSKVDYWIVTNCFADVLEKSAAFADVQLQVRLFGKVFRTQVTYAANDSSRGYLQFDPYLVIPANSDVRLTATADGANTDISGGIQGYLAIATDASWELG